MCGSPTSPHPPATSVVELVERLQRAVPGGGSADFRRQKVVLLHFSPPFHHSWSAMTPEYTLRGSRPRGGAAPAYVSGPGSRRVAGCDDVQRVIMPTLLEID